MKNLKVRVKLIISFLFVLLLAVIVGIFGIVGMSSIESGGRRMYEENLLAVEAAGNIRENLQAQRINMDLTLIYYPGTNEYANALSSQAEHEKEMLNLFEAYQATIVDDDDQSNFNELKRDYTNDFSPARDEVFEGAATDNHDIALSAMANAAVSINDIIYKIETMFADNVAMAAYANAYNAWLFNLLTLILVVVLVLAIIIALILSFYISGIISTPLKFLQQTLNSMSTTGRLILPDDVVQQNKELSTRKDEIGMICSGVSELVEMMNLKAVTLEAVADGDLTAAIVRRSSDDTIGNALQHMSDNLNSMFLEIGSASNQVSTGSKQIADGSQALAQGSTQQTSAIEQLSSSISDLADKTTHNAEIAREAANLSGVIKGNAEKGSSQMEQMMEAVKGINDASSSISKVISVIDNIAFQTNILALNAAVEAARAGQHGKGFAVVAEEVRSLASKSADAAKETGVLIANSMEKAQLGAKIAAETAASLGDIVDGINRNSEIISDISRSSDEQANAISQINRGIDQVAQVVQQNNATAEESAAASEEMSSQSSLLQELIGRFKVKGAPATLQSGNIKKQLAMPSKPEYDGLSDYGKY